MKNLKALSFFTGAMGLDIGLKKAGIEIVLACESEKFIRETIKLNNPKLKVLKDINLYSAIDIRKEAGLKTNEKIDLIKFYKKELRNYPHSRSLNGIKSLASVRGISCGVKFAESFYINRLVE